MASACCDGSNDHQSYLIQTEWYQPPWRLPQFGPALEWRLEPANFSLEPGPLGRMLRRRPNPPSLGSAVVTLRREPGT